MEEEDEDVFLEHSQLYKYLQECEPDVNLRSGVDVVSQSTGYGFCNAWVTFKASLSSLVSRIWTAPSKDLYADVVNYYLKKHAEAILTSHVMVEEDADFLEGFLFANEKRVENADERPRIIELNLKWIASCSGIMFSYFGFKYLNQNLVPETSRSTQIIESVLIFGMLSSIVYWLMLSALSWHRANKLYKSLTVLKTFINHCERFAQNVRKSVGYVQEVEVISRGLLLTQPGTTFVKLEQSLLFPHPLSIPNSCRCTSLRLCVFKCVLQLIRETKMATIHILKSYPLRQEIDNPAHYISCIDIEEFGPLMNINVNDEKEVLCATDNLSLSSLKAVCQLFTVQLSELLRRLALCFVPECFVKSQNNAFDAVFWIVPLIVGPLVKILDESSSVLNDSFRFQNKLRHCTRKSTERRRPQNFSKHGAFMTAVSSLVLHTEVAFSRIEEFTNKIDSLDYLKDEHLDEKENKTNSEDYYLLSYQLGLISDDINATKACCEEVSLRLSKLFGIADESSIEIQEREFLPCSTITPGIMINADDRTDIAPEDQVFEAFISDAEATAENVDDNYMTGEEAKHNSQEKRNISKNLFRELKTVLKPRAKEWDERVARALGLPPESCLEDETQLLQETDSLPLRPEDNLNELLYPEQKVASAHQVSTMQMPFSDRTLKFDDLQMQSVGSSIAAMAANRSKMLKLSTCEEGSVFQFDGEACYSDDDADGSSAHED